MYFPYLRGKQYELLALRELVERDKLPKNIIPVIEPVKDNFANLNKALLKFVEKRLSFVLIINPRYGNLINSPLKIRNEVIRKQLDNYKKEFYLGFIISDRTRGDELDNFLLAYNEYQIFLIHYARFQNTNELNSILSTHKNVKFNCIIENSVGRQYRQKIKPASKFILIEDNFNRKKNNSEYGETDFFSVLYSTYSSEEFVGFGDYLIIGDEYSETGGPAYAVAIHLSEINDDDEIWIRHFVSDSNGTPVDPGGKFYEALRKLVKYIDSKPSKFKFSNACDEFRVLYKDKRFPGLGYVKKLSMQHHIELISELT